MNSTVRDAAQAAAGGGAALDAGVPARNQTDRGSAMVAAGAASRDNADAGATMVDSEDDAGPGADAAVRVNEASGIILDGTGKGVFVADVGFNAILHLDIAQQTTSFLSGCTQHSEETCPGTMIGEGPAFRRPDTLVLDSKRQRLVVGDTLLDEIFSVDLATGKREVLMGDGPAYEAPRSFALAPDGDRVWVLCQISQSILELDLTTGHRSLVSGCAQRAIGVDACTSGPLRGAGPEFQAPQTVLYDAARARLLVTDLERLAVIAVDPVSGDRSFVAGCTEPPPTNRCMTYLGSGGLFSRPRDAVLDEARDRLIVHTLDKLTSVDLTSGDREVFSAADEMNLSLKYVWGMTLDAANGRILLLNAPDFVSVDLTSGTRSLVPGTW